MVRDVFLIPRDLQLGQQAGWKAEGYGFRGGLQVWEDGNPPLAPIDVIGGIVRFPEFPLLGLGAKDWNRLNLSALGRKRSTPFDSWVWPRAVVGDGGGP